MFSILFWTVFIIEMVLFNQCDYDKLNTNVNDVYYLTIRVLKNPYTLNICENTKGSKLFR